MVVAGLDVAAMVFERYDPEVEVTVVAADGDRVEKGTLLLKVSGPARSLLTAERPALNIVQHLSGIATRPRGLPTASPARAPSHRHPQDHARIAYAREARRHLRRWHQPSPRPGRRGPGQGQPHRNFRQHQGRRRARKRIPTLTKIEVECDNLDQVREALAGNADAILLDNMPLADMREAVRIVGGRIPLEASGGIALTRRSATSRRPASTISAGRITQAAPGVDIGLDEAA